MSVLNGKCFFEEPVGADNPRNEKVVKAVMGLKHIDRQKLLKNLKFNT